MDYMDEMSFKYIVGSNGSIIHSESDDQYEMRFLRFNPRKTTSVVDDVSY